VITEERIMVVQEMRRLQYDRYGPPEVLRVEWVPLPVPQPGQALVRVHAVSVNRGEVWGRAGRLRLVTRGPFPRGVGVDFAGVLAEVNGDPGGLRIGDPVWGVLEPGNISSGVVGTAADYAVVPFAQLGRSPASVTATEAVSLLAGGSNAIDGLRHSLDLRADERLLVRVSAISP
jgi:NADPH:quinone reductase-like Zn-dependent oxidoreductase